MLRRRSGQSPDEADRNVASLERANLIFRWATYGWVVISAASEIESFIRPVLVWGSLLVIGAWTLWLTLRRVQVKGSVLLADVALSSGLIAVSGLVVPSGQVVVKPLFALTYPFSTALAAGTAHGPVAGVGAGVALSLAYGFSRTLNGLTELTPAQVQHLVNGAIQYMIAGALFGLVSSLLRRSAEEVKNATAAAMAARERAARLAERESMARQIHDSVLQALAFIHKKGKEVAAAPAPSPADVASLAQLAAQHEASLRSLLLKKPDEGPSGTVSLRSALEAAAGAINEVEVSVSSVGPIWLPKAVADEVVAAVREALSNVVKHAEASKAAIFADEHEELLQVTVRDDGVGFDFDESKLRTAGKFGLLNSMRGRVMALGGTMRVESGPGAGTEVEFTIPISWDHES
ncbi:MAG: ATP-binding protein [Actinomycetota bacterium]|nr:ATP-binding protein [Actinomycetota bacterium]